MPAPNDRRQRFTIPERLLDRRRTGEITLREMAQACGVCIATVWQELKRQGFATGRPRRPRNETSRHQAALLRAQGRTLPPIARQLKVTKQRVHHLLKYNS